VAKAPSKSLVRDILASISRGTLKVGDRLPAFDRMGRQHRMSVV
jgi:hypothetical protein